VKSLRNLEKKKEASFTLFPFSPTFFFAVHFFILFRKEKKTNFCTLADVSKVSQQQKKKEKKKKEVNKNLLLLCDTV